MFALTSMNTFMLFFFRLYNKKRSYDPIDYECIDETEFWIIDENELGELDFEELENLLYEEESKLIHEVESSNLATHIG